MRRSACAPRCCRRAGCPSAAPQCGTFRGDFRFDLLAGPRYRLDLDGNQEILFHIDTRSGGRVAVANTLSAGLVWGAEVYWRATPPGGGPAAGCRCSRWGGRPSCW